MNMLDNLKVLEQSKKFRKFMSILVGTSEHVGNIWQWWEHLKMLGNSKDAGNIWQCWEKLKVLGKSKMLETYTNVGNI